MKAQSKSCSIQNFILVLLLSEFYINRKNSKDFIKCEYMHTTWEKQENFTAEYIFPLPISKDL